MFNNNIAVDLDRANIIAIDVSIPLLLLLLSLTVKTQANHDVRPDSTLILHAAREVVEGIGFNEMLDSVRDRVDEIESLHRTRELTVGANSIVLSFFRY